MKGLFLFRTYQRIEPGQAGKPTKILVCRGKNGARFEPNATKCGSATHCRAVRGSDSQKSTRLVRAASGEDGEGSFREDGEINHRVHLVDVLQVELDPGVEVQFASALDLPVAR